MPAFIDGSCRREPDFESRFPSITAACRGRNFAPRLHVGDRVAYLSVKHKYPGDAHSGWRLVAVLRVIRRFSSHEAAASWYRASGVPLPSNCIVDGNPPIEFVATNGNPPAEVRVRVCGEANPAKAVRLWDATYRRRVNRWPVFLLGEAEFRETVAPLQVLDADLREVFGRIPGTRNPPEIDCTQLARLLQVARGRAA